MTTARIADRKHTRQRRMRAGVPAQRVRGFTLVELMVVVAIIAILAGIGYPAYQDQTQKSRRADSKAALLELVQFMERNFTVTGRYNVDSTGAAIGLPFTEAPKAGAGRKFYDLRFQAGTLSATAYTLEAVPKNGQNNDTLCGTLRIDQAGQKTETGTGTPADCW